jgi:hypothetical protein
MWVFDGEEWIEEGVSEASKRSERSEMPMPLPGEFLPELQVIEITHTQVPQKSYDYVPFPLP